jgi:pilus assembly protein Flp/PilA
MTKMFAALFTVHAWLEARMDDDRERGATMIEYGLLAGLISIAALAAIKLIGPALLATFNEVAAAL